MSDKKDMKPKDENDDRIVKCEDIQDLLLEYAARELGDSRSALVREHLLYCDNCKESFEEIMDTISALEDASAPDEELPDKLSEKHYARVIRALTHPVLDWIAVNHKVVAIITAIIVLIATIFALNNIKVVKREKPDMGYEIYLRPPPASARTNDAPLIIWRSSKGIKTNE